MIILKNARTEFADGLVLNVLMMLQIPALPATARSQALSFFKIFMGGMALASDVECFLQV